MSSEWAYKSISEIAEINPSRPIKKGTVTPFIDMAALPTHSRDVEGVITTREYKGGGSKFQNGDTLVARITPCLENGKTAFVNCVPDDVIAHGSTEFIVLTPRNDNDATFMYYLARSDAFREYAIARMEGTSGRQRVPNAAVINYEFYCPPKEQRIEISKFLMDLDDRITLLRETNKTLESIAQAIFKSWFVDFDPVRAKMESRQPEGMDEETAALFPDSLEESELGLIPRGWRAGKIADLTSLSKGSINPGSHPKEIFQHFSLPAFDAGQMPVLEPGSTIKSNKTIVPSSAVLLSKLNPHIPRIWLPSTVKKEAICSTEFLPFIPNGAATTAFIYCLLSSPEFSSSLCQLVTGTSNSHQRIKPNVVLSLPTIIPSVEAVKSFDSVISVLLVSLRANRLRIQNLSSLRDTLLPRLISGQLRLPEAEELTETALS